MSLNHTTETGTDYRALINGPNATGGLQPQLSVEFDTVGGELWSVAAVTDRPDSEATQFETIDVSAFSDLLLPGENANVLAIHGMNSDADDDDFLIVPELVATTTVLDRNSIVYFSEPTSGELNGHGFTGLVADTKFDSPDAHYTGRGFYDAPFTVELSSATVGARIYYTTDGSVPHDGSGGQPAGGVLYTDPIEISTTTTLRAAAFQNGFLPTNVDTQTYIFLEGTPPEGVINQPNNPVGFPSSWGPGVADYEMDPAIVENALYSETIVDDLKSAPTLSLVMDVDDIFGPNGIYSNTEQRGEGWERPVSVEYFDPNNLDREFQIDAGLRIQGGSARHPANPKHGLRLMFKSEYGASKLEFPFFEDSPVDRFDTIMLLPGGHDGAAWMHTDVRPTTFLRDQFLRQSSLDMGRSAAHGDFVHLYINGLYWGLYRPTERPDHSFAAEYFGGNKDDYDAVKHRSANGSNGVINQYELISGNADAWNAMFALADGGLAGDDQYQAIQEYLDVENLIDYLIVNMHTGNQDWPEKNWYAARKREPGAGFRFYSWDGDFILGLYDIDADRTGVNGANNPAYLYSKLRDNAEFRLLMADRIQKHLFHDGALTAEEMQQRFQAIADDVERAIVAESARWGDACVDEGCLYTLDANWRPAVDYVLNDVIYQRFDASLEDFTNAGLYPAIDAPEFLINAVAQYGGAINAGDALTMTADVGTTNDTVLLTQGDAAMAFVPINDSLETGAIGQRWFDETFTPAVWIPGTNGVGYENEGDDGGPVGPYTPLIGTDVQTQWDAAESSVYSRFEFNLAAGFDPDQFDSLTLHMKYDDGFVAYLNGTRVASSFAPASPTWESKTVNGSRNEPDSLRFQEFVLTNTTVTVADLLHVGTNVLAIQGLNVNTGSTDLLILPELVVSEVTSVSSAPIYYTTDGTDSRLPGGAINTDTAVLFDGEFPVDETVLIRARVFTGSTWSALSETIFVVELPLRITEIMYNPPGQMAEELAAAGVAYGNDQYEFVELINNHDTATVNIEGVHFTEGLQFTFGNVDLAPGERIVVVRNQTAFENRYGADVRVAGQYGDPLNPANDSKLANSGERLQLADAGEGTILDFTFGDDDWYPETDGDGFSLIVKDTAGDYNDPANWRSSAIAIPTGGSPGQIDPLPVVGDINGDGVTYRGDAAILVRNLGRTDNSHRGRGDVNGDRATTLVDLALLQVNLAASPPSPQAMAASAVTSPVPDDSRIATDVVFADMPRHARRVALTTRIARRGQTQTGGNVEARHHGVQDVNAATSRVGRSHFTSSLRVHRSRRMDAENRPAVKQIVAISYRSDRAPPNYEEALLSLTSEP